MLFNNNFIAIKNPVLHNVIKSALIGSSQTMDSLQMSGDPRWWVGSLYGPNVVGQAILEPYAGKKYSDISEQEEKLITERIKTDISVNNTSLFLNKHVHRQEQSANGCTSITGAVISGSAIVATCAYSLFSGRSKEPALVEQTELVLGGTFSKGWIRRFYVLTCSYPRLTCD